MFGKCMKKKIFFVFELRDRKRQRPVLSAGPFPKYPKWHRLSQPKPRATAQTKSSMWVMGALLLESLPASFQDTH